MPNGTETQKQRFPKLWSLESQATEAGAQSEVAEVWVKGEDGERPITAKGKG